MNLRGEGNVYSQSVTASNKVVKGTKVTITCQKNLNINKYILRR